MHCQRAAACQQHTGQSRNGCRCRRRVVEALSPAAFLLHVPRRSSFDSLCGVSRPEATTLCSGCLRSAVVTAEHCTCCGSGLRRGPTMYHYCPGLLCLSGMRAGPDLVLKSSAEGRRRPVNPYTYPANSTHLRRHSGTRSLCRCLCKSGKRSSMEHHQLASATLIPVDNSYFSPCLPTVLHLN